MTKSELAEKIRYALSGDGFPPGTSPEQMTIMISVLIANAIAEYVENLEG